MLTAMGWRVSGEPSGKGSGRGRSPSLGIVVALLLCACALGCPAGTDSRPADGCASPSAARGDGPPLHVALLGGAFAAGRDLAPERAWACRLRQRLEDLRGPVQVDVRARAAATLGDLVGQLDRAVDTGRPDLIVVAWPGTNGRLATRAGDTVRTPASSSRSSIGRVVRELRAMAALRLAGFETAGDALAARYADPRDPLSTRANATLETLARRARDAETPLVVLVVPDARDDLLFGDPLAPAIESFLAACKRHAVRCIDPRDRLAAAADDPNYRASPLGPAPGPRFHAITAEAVLQHAAVELGLLGAAPTPAATPVVSLYERFEVFVDDARIRANPFADVIFDGVFVAPSGRRLALPGYYDGESEGEPGARWRTRFMPDEVGAWRYFASTDDGAATLRGHFTVVGEGAAPGPWHPIAEHPQWMRTAQGDPVLPTAAIMNASYLDHDWDEALDWIEAKRFDTLVAAAFNSKVWGEGWPNPTPFATADTLAEGRRRVDYARPNLAAWRRWDGMLERAAARGIYVAPFDGPSGDYGGQTGVGTVYPPSEIAYGPALQVRFDDPRNLRVLRTLVGRQAGFWNLAYWNLYTTEIFEVKARAEVVAYFEAFARITPFGRMLTAQDVQQNGRAWLDAARIPAARKLNTTQIGDIGEAEYQQAAPNHAFVRAHERPYPHFATEALWEGQPRGDRPVPMIWGALTGGAAVAWADLRYDDGVDGGRWGSIGRGWVPRKALDEPVFSVEQLGLDTTGDEALPHARDLLMRVEYWRTAPAPERIVGGAEAYCLAEPGRQFIVYMPEGGLLNLDLRDAEKPLSGTWYDAGAGVALASIEAAPGAVVSLEAPSDRDVVLILADPARWRPGRTADGARAQSPVFAEISP